jgi:multidrug efflux pump
MYLSFFSNDLDRNQITDYLTRVVQPKLSAISGVQSAEILGARVFAMRIWMKTDRMTALNVSPQDIQTALQNNNYLAGVGQTKGSMVAINLVTNTNLETAEEFKQLVIKQGNGAIVRLRDVADIDLGAEDYNTDVRFSGSTATFMGIFVLPTANTLDVIKRVREALPDIERELPTGMKMAIPYDSTLYIQSAIEDVIRTLTETILIVIIVIFLFMGSFRSVLIPIVAIPLSLVGAFFLMLLFGFTLNLLTLLAIVLAVGLVVDDAIVVVENVERHLKEGMKPFDAAIKGARELFGPIIAMTISLATVYAPIGLQGGLSGSLFREFAFTLSGAVAISGVVALTLSPMMSSKLLKQGMAERGFAGWITRRFDGLRRSYAKTLTWALGYWPVTCIMAVLFICLAVPFYLMSKKEPAPREDQGVIFGIVQTPPNATVEQNMLFTQQMDAIYKSFPECAQTFQVTTATQGFSGMVAKPWSERKRTMDEVLVDVNHKLAQIPGVEIFATTPSPLPGGTNFPVEMVISSTAEPREIYEFAQELVQAAMKSGKFVFADTDLKYDLPEANIVFDRDKVGAMGLNLGQVGGDLATLLGGGYTNYFSIQGRSYKVIPQVKRTDRLTTDDLKNLYVTGPNGQPVQLATFARIDTTVQPRSLNRFQQLNSATIQGLPNKFAGATTDDALKVLEKKAAEILPKGYTIDYTGEARQLRKEGDTFLATLALAGVLIYLVLAAQFESFRDPLIILCGSVPLGLTGALAVTFLGITTINAYSYVGLVTLVGLVCKNGILIVEFANRRQENGRDKFNAVIEAASTRLRPILMTSVATVAGHTPLILAHGPGAGARNSIGWVLVTGMIVGTLLTLFVLPAVYMLVAKNHNKSRQREGDLSKLPEERKLYPALA